MVSKILNAMGTKESKEKIHSDSRENSISRIYNMYRTTKV